VNIIKGYFPGDLGPDAKFDVIVFNDVFEHLPNPHEAMGSIAERLNSGGALVINIPNSEGFFYRTASMLDVLGIPGPLRRMWQVNFPSPHISYFNPASLARLAGRSGLTEVHRSTLSSVTVDGLWQRLRHVRHLQPANVVVSAGVWMAVAALSPVISRLPSDVSLQIFKKTG
jgi:SAM-dependent methyltransferase